jgi:uncharacterized repeat protein (TIGR01451 family)
MKHKTKMIGLLLLPLLLYFSLTGYGQTITASVTGVCTPGTGAVTFSITGGTAGYTFYLTRLSYGGYAPQTSPTFTNLPSGSYYVYASNGTDSLQYYFSDSAAVSVQVSITNATCRQANGGAVALASGGTGPYTYQWIDSNAQSVISGGTISSTAAGTYYVIAKDNNGCVSDTIPVVISASSPITVSIVNDRSICAPILKVNSAGGAVPYTYAWNTLASADSIYVSSSGTYDVTVTDNNGCTTSQSYYIAPLGLTLDSFASSSTQPTCSNNNGSITVFASQLNGTAPYTFQWSNGSTDSIATGLASATYTLTVTDAHGCSGTATYTLYGNNIYAYNNGYTNPTCGASDGSITIAAYNGTSPYQYVWSNSETGATISNLPAGTYTATVTDANGCTTQSGITLVATGSYTVSVTSTPTACDTSLHTGSATAIISGTGTPPYSFAWYDNYNYPATLIGTTQTITGLSYGEYISVTVADSNGCVASNTQNGQFQDSIFIGFEPSCYDHITGYIFIDSNGNCIFGAGDAGVGGANVYATGQNGQAYYATSDSTGYYDIEVLPGTYTIQYGLYAYGGTCSATSCGNNILRDTFSAVGTVSVGNNFGIATGSTFDLGVHPGTRPSAPGSQKEYWVYYYNYGSTAASNALVSFTYDPSLTLVSTDPAYTSLNTATNTVSWSVGTVAPTSGNWYTGYLHMWFSVPQSDSLNQILYAQAEIDPIAGDCDPADNIVNISDVVTGSHDPNSKSVSPAGNLSATDTVLTYTIRFENDGNAPANTIVIVDTLSANVNPATFLPGASSFPGYKYAISGNGIVTFTFQGINLPDSSHGVSSEGFVSYSVQTQKNLLLYSQINNTAYVYFDANPAVVTNTTTSVRSDYPTGIKAISGSMSAQVVPNPAHDLAQIQFAGYTGTIGLRISDEVGNIVLTGTTEGSVYTLDAARFAPGIYFYTAQDKNGNKATGKISIVH